MEFFLLEKNIRLLFRALSIFCLMSIGYFVARFIWLLIVGAQAEMIMIENHVSSKGEEKAQVVVDIPQIQSLELFGQPEKIEINKPSPIITAPKTTLKLELLGVFLGNSGAASSAIIGEIGKSPESYALGDQVAPGVSLKEVRSDRVILNRNGRYETLEFDIQKNTGIQKGQSQNRSSANGGRSSFSETRANFLRRTGRGSSANQGAPARSKLGRMAKSGQKFSQAKIIEAIQDDLSQNPEQVISEMGLVPQGNSTSGYTIGSNAPQDLLKSFGLKVGDKVLSVDGQQLGNSISDAGLIQGVIQKGQARVKIQRGSRTFTVNLTVPENLK